MRPVGGPQPDSMVPLEGEEVRTPRDTAGMCAGEEVRTQ